MDIIDKGLDIENMKATCSCMCKHCFYCTEKRATGVKYSIGEELTQRFDKWRKNNGMHDFDLCYTVGHSFDYPELIDNLNFNKSIGSLSSQYLFINGIREYNNIQINDFLDRVYTAGVRYVNFTFLGMQQYHDRFANRENDFNYLMLLLEKVKNTGFSINTGIVLLEDNIEQIEQLLDIVKKYETNIYTFLVDYRGRGIDLENIRLTRNGINKMPEKVKAYFNAKKYKTESEWIAKDQWEPFNNRRFRLALRQDNIETIMNMSCDEIINHLKSIDENYYNAIPSMTVLAKRYGEKGSDTLYSERDLRWKWEKCYLKENKIDVEDIVDERLSGSMRK
jgi:hypothetical protein